MPKKLKFRPRITRVKLNPEQAVLFCNCFSMGRSYLFTINTPHLDTCTPTDTPPGNLRWVVVDAACNVGGWAPSAGSS